MRTFAIFAVSCWSGFLMMAVEILSGRILAPTFGNSIYVWGAIITVFMVALSAGYLLGARISLMSPTVPQLCALHALSGLLLIPILLFDTQVIDAVFAVTEDPRFGSLAGSLILFFLPALVCGTVSPVAVKLLVRDAQAAGFYAGLQYFFSTFFSAAGTLMTSFYFVLVFEVDQILMLLLAITLVVAGATYLLSRKAV